MIQNKVYIVQKGIEILDGYTSLKKLSNDYGLPYRSIMGGRRKFVRGEDIYIVTALEIKKIKGRGRY